MKTQKFDRHSTIALEVVLPLIQKASNGKTRDKAEINGQLVGYSSLRLRTFAKGTKCTCCGLEATHFALERDLALAARNGNYHLNLYGMKNGEEVLFTHDHTLARALGGKDHSSNTTTMCGPCNWEKGRREQEEVLRLKDE